MNEIVQTLEKMCSKDDPQDRKLLLLATLVDTKYEVLAKNHTELKESLHDTNRKLDKLMDLLEKYEADKNSCPVYRDKPTFEKMAVYLKYPRVTFLVVIGILAVLLGTIGPKLESVVKLIIGL